MEPNLIDLFELARQGDRVALEQLLVALCARFHRYAYTILRHQQDAEDAAQQAALDLIRCAVPGRNYVFLNEKDFASFVLLIVARASWRIRHGRQLSLDPIDYRLTELLDPLSDDESVDRADDVRCLMSALDAMEPDDMETGDRALLEMRYIQGLDSTAIGNLTGTSASTIRGRLRAARRRLEEEVRRRAPQLAALFDVDNAD